MKRALWLHGPGFKIGSRRQAESLMDKAGLTGQFTIFLCAESIVPKWVVKRHSRTKKALQFDEQKRLTLHNKLAEHIEKLKPSIIIINDDDVLKSLVGQNSCETCRGSLYYIQDVPAIVLGGIHQVFYSSEFKFFLAQDIGKIQRIVNGKLRNEPRFVYSILNSIADLISARDWLAECVLISKDIETCKTGISSISWTGIHPSGDVRTFVCPFVNPLSLDGCWWGSEEEEVQAWGIVREICENSVPKILQNGLYDAAWFFKYGIALNNYILDTEYLWHSIWSEIRKALEIITSVSTDQYRYWKAEIKGETEYNETTKKKEPKDRIPKTEAGFSTYLRYNGLDSHYTALSGCFLIRLITAAQYSWALANYCKDFELETGPYFAMSMRGVRCSPKRQTYYYDAWMQESNKHLKNLRTMADDPTFNPRSPIELGSLIYDVLGGKAPNVRGKGIKKDDDTGKAKRSVDEKILKFVKRQHPVLDWVIQEVWDFKKPLNNATKYGQAQLLGKDRYMYKLNLLTESGRCTSSEHHYWLGANIQNVPAKVRPMFVADPDYYMWEADYAQSDAYFVAFYSEDENFIRNILAPEDTHCLHTEFFFKEPYDKVYKAYKNKEDWAVDPITGVRQNSKRITHGANYQMSGGTLYVVMGHEAVQATALAMGHKDCYTWSSRRYGQFCQSLVDAYLTQLYPRLPVWFKETVNDAIANKNRVQVYGGLTRLFLGDLRKDPAAQRELSSFYGQGGTAGNINRTIREAWFSGEIEIAANIRNQEEFYVNIQCHDSFTGNVKQSNEGLRQLDKFLTIMEKPVTVLGREFQIPVECEIGLGWKSGTVGYHKGMSHEELIDKVLKKEDEFNVKRFGGG